MCRLAYVLLQVFKSQKLARQHLETNYETIEKKIPCIISVLYLNCNACPINAWQFYWIMKELQKFWGSWRLGFLVPKYYPKTSLIFTFWQFDSIGLAQPSPKLSSDQSSCYGILYYIYLYIYIYLTACLPPACPSVRPSVHQMIYLFAWLLTCSLTPLLTYLPTYLTYLPTLLYLTLPTYLRTLPTYLPYLTYLPT